MEPSNDVSVRVIAPIRVDFLANFSSLLTNAGLEAAGQRSSTMAVDGTVPSLASADGLVGRKAGKKNSDAAAASSSESSDDSDSSDSSSGAAAGDLGGGSGAYGGGGRRLLQDVISRHELGLTELGNRRPGQASDSDESTASEDDSSGVENEAEYDLDGACGLTFLDRSSCAALHS